MKDKSKNSNTYIVESNTYIIEMDMNANYIVSGAETEFCNFCGREIDEGRFCDRECRRDYYSEIHNELSSFGRWE